MGCHFLLQGIFSTQGLNPLSLVSPALADGFFTTEPRGNSTFDSSLMPPKFLMTSKPVSERPTSGLLGTVVSMLLLKLWMWDMDQLGFHLSRDGDSEHRFNSKSENVSQSSLLITCTKHCNNIASIHPGSVPLLAV